MKVILDADVLIYQALPRDPYSAFALARENYVRIKQNILEASFGTSIASCVSLDGVNFRKNEYPSYKHKRKLKEPPEHLFDLKAWVLENDPDVIGSTLGEGDDIVLQLAADELEAGRPFVVASVDKDIKTLGPMTYYNMRTRDHSRVTPEEAYKFIISQMIHGDPGDDIPGIRGIGPGKTEKFLATLNGSEEMFHGAKSIWQEKEGKNWESGFNDTCNLSFIRRRESDLRQLDFADMSFDDFVSLLRFPLPDYPKE